VSEIYSKQNRKRRLRAYRVWSRGEWHAVLATSPKTACKQVEKDTEAQAVDPREDKYLFKRGGALSRIALNTARAASRR
jgi:hypothetical protein